MLGCAQWRPQAVVFVTMLALLVRRSGVLLGLIVLAVRVMGTGAASPNAKAASDGVPEAAQSQSWERETAQIVGLPGGFVPGRFMIGQPAHHLPGIGPVIADEHGRQLHVGGITKLAAALLGGL